MSSAARLAPHRRAAALLLAAAVLVTGAACSPTARPDADAATPVAPAAAPAAVAPTAVAPAVDPAALPHPSLDTLLPAGLPQADHVTGLAATPRTADVAGYTAPGGEAVLGLEADALGLPASWAVTDLADGWVQVLVPFGRGARPSADPARTNHTAVWVRDTDVDVADAPTLALDLSDRTVTVAGRTYPVGVGRDETPTPTGLCAVVGRVFDPHVGDALLTSCQSEAMDEYQTGSGYAVVALHADPEAGAAVGAARSNGCVRLRADDFTSLLATVTPGATVQITA